MFEGDIIRPLGLVTLYFGYAEYEVDAFLERLSSAGRVEDGWRQRPLGQKLTLLMGATSGLTSAGADALAVVVADARPLLEARNSLVHGCIVGGGRVTSGRADKSEGRTSAAELENLAEQIFSWKERLWATRWKQIEPQLAPDAAVPPNTSLERSRDR